MSATYLIVNLVQHALSKHIDDDYHFVREMVAKGGLKIRHVPTQLHVADISTKGLSSNLYVKYSSNLSIVASCKDYKDLL